MHEMPGRRQESDSGGARLDQALTKAAANEAVRGAEQTVCDAWLAELIEADRAAADTLKGCWDATDAARAALCNMLLAGDAPGIATSHAALDECIRSLQRSMAGYAAIHALLTDQRVLSTEAAALRDDEAATDRHRVGEVMRRPPSQ